MKIKDLIENQLISLEDKKASQLWNVCKEIIDAVIPHNKRIIAQMSNYDMHDDTHSEKVLEIIEKLLGEKGKELTFYELVLIYMSAYLHDSAMAVPEWEYRVLKAVEGTEQLCDNTLAFYIGNDFKPVHKFSEALKLVSEHKDKILNYHTAREYIFVQENEEKVLNSLAELICEYEKFRNGYIENLKKYRDCFSEYYNMSQMIRSEFIRQKHHIRAAQNISALKRRFCTALGDRCAQYFTEDLANVCRCHGEEIKEIFGLEVERKDWMGNISNIQFAAILLRLGDVIHFGADRAPLSLFAEKQITDEDSYKHWKAKFQELSYEIVQENQHTVISYQAYCIEPDVYYFIQDYLDGVDQEIGHYYMLKNQWEVFRLEKLDVYMLSLATEVNRQEIGYDQDCFTPDKDMKFVINQAKILELLMGIQLYKDKYLCLRELYQNALDASKCMLAYNKKNHRTERMEIVFGIAKEQVQGVERKYIYCLDHGTGMNSYIIKNCLLHIGNSYYKSKEFARKNTDWAFDVNPTSQFGIGILSGYMIADKIGISTVHYEEKNQYLSFVLEGVSEHFYYTKTSQIDRELLGEHGTIVKLYLKPELEEAVNAKYFEKMQLAFLTRIEEIRKLVCDKDILRGNLFYIIAKHIGIENPGIRVRIMDEDGISREIYQNVSLFDTGVCNGMSDSKIGMLWGGYYLEKGLNLYKEYHAKRDKIKNYVIKAADSNLELYSCISLPKKNMGQADIRIFDFCKFLRNGTSVCVDGIRINSGYLNGYNEIGSALGYDILNGGILNYVGVKRPLLSVDRNSIVEIPKMDKDLQKLRMCFIEELKRIILGHLKSEAIDIEDYELLLVFDFITRRFPVLSSELMFMMKDSKYSEVTFGDLAAKNNKLSIKELFDEKELLIEDTDFTQYREITRQILLGRMINAKQLSIDGCKLFMSGGTYTQLSYLEVQYERYVSLRYVAVRADQWKGEYAEYDLVNRLWPVVSPDFFNQLQDYSINTITERCKTVYGFIDGICDIASLDPVLIHPALGIGTKKYLNENVCCVGEFGEIKRSYSLYELSNHGKLTEEEKISLVLFAFIAPRKLRKQEEIQLAELETEDPQYVKGVREGWSILFLGAIEKYVIVPGRTCRKQIAEKIPERYKKLRPDIQYLFTDGSRVF